MKRWGVSEDDLWDGEQTLGQADPLGEPDVDVVLADEAEAEIKRLRLKVRYYINEARDHRWRWTEHANRAAEAVDVLRRILEAPYSEPVGVWQESVLATVRRIEGGQDDRT